MIASKNPYSQEILAEYLFLSNKALNQELSSIKNCFSRWSVSLWEDRKKFALQLQQLLLERKESLSILISKEMGKPLKEAFTEIEKCAELVGYFSEHFQDLLASKKLTKNAFVSYHPTGAVFGIMPWNFPFWQVFRYAIPNLLAGNVCILKHAPNVFGCANAIAQLFVAAGFPKHVFTSLTIDLPQVETVIAHPIVQGVCVTGSTRAGSSVAALAGKHLKKSVLELGGTDAFAILKDADFPKALTQAFTSRMRNGGQVCIAAKRIYIPKETLEIAVEFLSLQLQQLVLGNPLDPKTTLGPMAKEDFLPILQQQVEGCIAQGAELVLGGTIKAPFYEPTLLIVNPENPMLKEEIFGPVICVIPYEDEPLLIKEINDTDYGLGASVWSKDLKKATAFAAQIEAGLVAINSPVASDPRLPFGGIKNSGYGKELGTEGFTTFLNAKTVVVSD